MKYWLKKISAAITLGVMVSVSLPLTTVAQSLQAPVQEEITVANSSPFQQLPESTESIYFSQKQIQFDAKEALATIKKLSAGIDEILAQVDELDKEFDSSNSKYQRTKKEIFAVIKDLKQAKDSLNESIEKIDYYQTQIVESAEKVKEIRAQMDITKAYVERFSQFLYKFHNDLYNDQGAIDEIKLFLHTDSHIGDELSNSYLVESMIKKLEELMAKLKEEEKKQILVVRKSNEFKRTAQETIDYYQQRINDLNQKREYLLDFLELYKENHEKIEGTIKALFDTRLEAQQQIEAVVDEITKKQYTVWYNVGKQLVALDTMKEYQQGAPTSVLDWPLYPINDIRYFFQDESYKEEFGVDMPGIEIPTLRVPLYAPDSALVYKISNKGGLGVNWVILVHRDGYISILKFFSELTINEGDIVRRGQIIGYTGGGSPLLNGAGFVSQWPNLTFMTLKDGEFVDPLSLLDLSVIRNKGILPKDLKIEYLRDLYALDRDRYLTKFTKGTSTQERFANFLAEYGVGIYADPLFWEDAAQGQGVAPHFLACIGLAETSFKNFKSSNNIGNVGNDDAWNTVIFASPAEGAKYIGKTLNNQHLHQYNTIAELNGMFNPEGKNYATSRKNWQTNLINCMSTIEWFFVPDNYPFRTAPTYFGTENNNS